MNPTGLQMSFSFVPLGLGFIRLVAALPPTLGVALGRLIGTFCSIQRGNAVSFANEILLYASQNLARPTNTTLSKHALNKMELINGDRMVLHRPINFVYDKIRVSGQELLEQANIEGRGVLLLCPHYSMLDLVAPLMHAVAGRFGGELSPQ